MLTIMSTWKRAIVIHIIFFLQFQIVSDINLFLLNDSEHRFKNKGASGLAEGKRKLNKTKQKHTGKAQNWGKWKKTS